MNKTTVFGLLLFLILSVNIVYAIRFQEKYNYYTGTFDFYTTDAENLTFNINCDDINFSGIIGSASICDGVDDTSGAGGANFWVDNGTWLEPNATRAINIRIPGYINASDWSNVQITEDQITDLDNYVTNTTMNHSVHCSNIDGATSNLCSIVDTDTYNTTLDMRMAINYSIYYSILVNWSNIQNKPTNLDIDSTNDLTTSTSFGGEVSGTYDNIVINDNALDDQYFDSESDLTSLLDDNYVSRNNWADLDNYPSACSAGQYVYGLGDTLSCSTPTDTNTNCSALNTCNQIVYSNNVTWITSNEQDLAHDTCAEISGCVENAITDGNTNWDNSYGFVTNVTMNHSVYCSNIDGATSNLCTLTDTDTYNTTSDIKNAINSTNTYYEIKVNCSNVWFDNGYGASTICDGDDAVGAGGGGAGMWNDLGTYLEPNITYASNVNIPGYINASDWGYVIDAVNQTTYFYGFDVDKLDGHEGSYYLDDTYNTTLDMRNAINVSLYYQLLVNWSNINNKPQNLDEDSTNDLTTSTSWGGDLSGTGNSPTVKDNSHAHHCSNITGAVSDLCSIVDTDTDTVWTIKYADFINNSNILELNWTTINTTIDARDDDTNTNCSGINSCDSVVYSNNASWVQSNELDSAHDECSEISGCVVGAITDGNTNWDNSYGFVTNITMNHSVYCSNIDGSTSNLCTLTDTDTYNTTREMQVAVNYSIYYQLLVNWSNILEKPANLDTDSTNDLTTSTSWSGDLSGTGSSPTVKDSSHAHHCSNITGAVSDLCTIVDTDTFNTTQEMRDAVNISAEYNIISSDVSCNDCLGQTEISDIYVLNNGDTATGAYTFTDNITIEKVILETDSTNHRIYDNSTCVIIEGDTSTLSIC